MKNDEKGPSFIGVFKMPCYKGEAGNKVLKLFNKLKRRAEQTETMPRSESGQITPSHEEMQYRAMNSYRLKDEVIKTDGGFEVG